MDTQQKKRHIDAFLTNFELACQLSMIVIAADMIWLIHDVLANGLSVTYSVIFTLMVIGFIGTGYVIHRHHVDYTNKLKKRFLFWRRKEKAKKVKVLAKTRPEIIPL